MRWDHLNILKDVLWPYHQCPSLCIMCLALVTPLAPSSRMEVGPGFFFSHKAFKPGPGPSLPTDPGYLPPAVRAASFSSPG